MDSADWKKFLSSAGAVRIQKDNETRANKTSALKLLLGHWQNLRKKPLLHQDDVEAPQTQGRTNPLFVDDSDDNSQKGDKTAADKDVVIHLSGSQEVHSPSVKSSQNDEHNSQAPGSSQKVFIETETNSKENLAAAKVQRINETMDLKKRQNEVHLFDRDSLSSENLKSDSKVDPTSKTETFLESNSKSNVKTSLNEKSGASKSARGRNRKKSKKKKEQLKKGTVNDAYPEALDLKNKHESVNHESVNHETETTDDLKVNLKSNTNASVEKVSTSSYVEDQKNLSNIKNPNIKLVKKIQSETQLPSETEATFRRKPIDELIKKFQEPSVEKRALHHADLLSEIRNHTKVPKTKSDEHLNNDKIKPALEVTVEESSLLPKRNLPVTSLPFKLPPPPPDNELQKTLVEDNSAFRASAMAVSSRIEGETRSDSSLNRQSHVTSSHSKGEVKNRQYIKNVQKGNKEKRKSITDSASNKKIFLKALSSNASKIEYKSSETSHLDTPREETQNNFQTTQPETSTLPSNKLEQPVSQSLDSNEISVSHVMREDYENVEHVLGGSGVTNTTPKQIWISADASKVQSEDSGITRGDQISDSSASQNPHHSHSDDKKSKSETSAYDKIQDPKHSLKHKVRPCKHCRSRQKHYARGQCDDYYDKLISALPQRSRQRNSWTSDISWEDFVEREYFRQLRNKRPRASLRSNALSRRDGLKSRFSPSMDHIDKWSRLHRSFSDDRSSISTFNHFNKPPSSICSCEECQLAEKLANIRASVKAKRTSRHLHCTCALDSPSFSVDSRKVTFAEQNQSSLNSKSGALEVLPENTTNAAKSISTEELKESGSSPKAKEQVPKSEANGIQGNTSTFTSPWELEMWENKMKIHVLKSRRKRARFMGVMALALVAIVGIGVTLLIVVLRSKNQ